MNNYNWLQRNLHRLALSSTMMREVMFEIEKTLFFDDKFNNDAHVFITGLARSGSTMLLNSLYESNEFASLTYQDMPFILAPNLWSVLTGQKKHKRAEERAHGDGIKVSTNSPEAFDEVFWKTFNDNDYDELFRKYVACVLKKYKKKRYLSKNNQNIRRISSIYSIFPKASILIPFRKPLQQAYSLLSQHKRFINEQQNDKFILRYMSWIGHSEFGLDYQPIISENLEFENSLNLNHWLEQWYLAYQNVLNLQFEISPCQLVCYESLCEDKKVWFQIQENLFIEDKKESKFQESKTVIREEYDIELLQRAQNLYTHLKEASF